MTIAWRSFAIVPAAGHSTRMGQPKLLLPWRGRTVIEHTLAAWRAGGVTRTIVVTRPGDADLAAISSSTGAEVLTPAVAPPEMKDSIRAALEHLARVDSPTDADVWLLAPADMPWLSPSVIRKLLESHTPMVPRILVPVQGTQRGHPVLFPWPWAKLLDTLASHEGINSLLTRHSWTPVQVADGIIHGDLDTPEDYEKMQAT